MKSDITNQNEEDKEKKQKKVGLIIFFIMMCVIAILGTFSRDGIKTWLPTILKEKFMLSDKVSILCTLLLPLTSAIASPFCVLLNKKFKNMITSVMILFGLSLVMLVAQYFVFKTSILVLIVIIFALIVFWFTGIIAVVTSIAPLYLRNDINSGTSSGVLNGFCYVGGTLSSYLLGFAVDYTGDWEIIIIILMIIASVSLVGCILYLILTTIKHFPIKENKINK